MSILKRDCAWCTDGTCTVCVIASQRLAALAEKARYQQPFQPPAADVHMPTIYFYSLESTFPHRAIHTALERAAFLLRADGNGQFDREQAAVLDSLTIGEPRT